MCHAIPMAIFPRTYRRKGTSVWKIAGRTRLPARIDACEAVQSGLMVRPTREKSV
jgi:hypothetical protein